MFRKLSILMLTVLVSISCKKENSQPQWDLEVFGPIVYADLGIEHLFVDSLIRDAPDGALSLVYESGLYDLELDSVYQIPDTTIYTFVTWPAFPSTIQPNTSFYSNNNNVILGISNVQLTRAKIRSGAIILELRNTLPTKVIYTYTIPGALKNQVPFRIVQEVDAAGSNGPGVFTGSFDFSGYDVALTGASGNQFNTISYNVDALSDPNGNAFTVRLNDTLINVRTTLSGIEPSYVKGYLGQSNITETDTSSVGIGNLIQRGMIQLDSVQMDLDIDNYIGADARVVFQNIRSVNSRTGTVIDLQAPNLVNRVINVNRAIESGNVSQPVIPSHLNFSLNPGNSNVLSFIENIPDKLSYQANLNFNPLGNISAYNDFIYSDYLINSKIRIDLPLKFAASQVVLSDNRNLSVEGLTALDPIGNSELTLVAENGFPMEMNIQLFLLNASEQILDSLLIPGTIASAPVDGNYLVTSTKKTEIKIPFNEYRKQLFLESKFLGIRARFDTPDFPQKIQLYRNYRLKIRLIADGIYSIR